MARTKSGTPRTRSIARRGIKRTVKAAAPSGPEYTEKKVGGAKNGGTRNVPTTKAPRYYPAEDVLPPKRHSKAKKVAALRSNITPGTILILLAGRFRAKKVVFLKQLESGLLLVTGPYKVNGVPLRRVNQSYVIATSTKVDVSGVKLDAVNDAYFAKEKKKGHQSAEAEFFADGKPKEKTPLPEAKTSQQKDVDKSIIEQIKKTDNLGKYLKASWGLSKGQFPHQLVF
jgi:large subunit ribosomal protein L6e